MSGWRRILFNRFVLVPAAIVLVVAVWNVYVATHNHGLITGRVVDSAGRPVADATVALWVFNFTTYEEKERVKTDADGVFRFTNNPSHKIQLSAEKPGVGRSPRIPVFLYFRAQDTTLDSPLRFTGAG
ncbi:MAG TPA: carboxypeptidase-like regulatory domain-containing protein [Reyranella sp.]